MITLLESGKLSVNKTLCLMFLTVSGHQGVADWGLWLQGGGGRHQGPVPQQDHRGRPRPEGPPRRDGPDLTDALQGEEQARQPGGHS